MDKESCSIKFTETDTGFRVDVEGKSMKDVFSCGCVPMAHMVDCCSPKSEKEEKK